MPNRLAHESSPYLLQHADNPVDWHPWCEEALTLAREADRPILLSIGYSSCHWCHVMAHECFEDAEVARVMNEHFVNIKVDREERPDLDQIYQLAHQMIVGSGGGWPLTVFLTPDQIPFFAGTYFPKTPRHQLPGFLDLLPRVAAFYREHKAEIAAEKGKMIAALDSTLPAAASENELTEDVLARAAGDLARAFDRVWGGFGAAPKFPRPADLEFCLRWMKSDPPLREMALFTLEKMAQGGIFDQLGGGFYRYSVDDRWAIPHFEKMLYDNGPLLALYADAHALTGNPRFAQVCEETVGWLTREMRAPEGGFYSALDADSEHEEGKFYVWMPDEVRALLGAEEFAVAAAHYGLDGPANFEARHWHLAIAQALNEVATTLALEPERCKQALTSAKRKLFLARARRTRPGRDDKILTGWNALAIKGLARAARVLGRADWLRLAQDALDFIHARLRVDGRLYASFKDGQPRLNAYLDDHAFLLDALLELMRTEFRPADVEFARCITDTLLARFEDPQHGGFFFTSHDHERLIHRPKPAYDNATPAGNGVAAFALQRLGHLLGEPRYLAAAQRTLSLFAAELGEHPAAMPTLALALAESLTPPTVAVVRGPEPPLGAWRSAFAQTYVPDTLAIFVPNNAENLPPALNKPAGDTVNAWVCRGVNCLPAVTAADDLIALCKGEALG